MSRCRQNGGRCSRANASTAEPVTSAVNSAVGGVNSATTSNDPNGTFIEDMPMCHYVNSIPICGNGNGGDPEGEILAALQCQNQLLVDILGAINALTAAILGGRNCRNGSDIL